MKTIYIILLVVLGIVILLGTLFFIYYQSIMWQIHHYPKDNPYNYLKRNAGPIKTKKRIVFIGDSLTHGNMSVNYIELISEKLRKNNISKHFLGEYPLVRKSINELKASGRF